MVNEVNEEMPNLTDSEAEGAMRILAYIQDKYMGRPATFENLKSLSNEAIDRFEKLGLIVAVNIYDGMGKPKMPPDIVIEGRTSEFDPDKQGWEVKHAVANEERISPLLSGGEIKGKVKE